MSAISDCVGRIKGLTPKQRMILTIMLQGAALPLPLADGPTEGEKDRQRAVDKVITHAKRLRDAIANLDPDSRDYVGNVAISGDDDPLARNRNALKSYASLRELDCVLKRLGGLTKPYPPPYIVRREIVIASGVIEALELFGLPCGVSDTNLAAQCFRAVAQYAGVEVADSPRHWLKVAKAKDAEK